MRIPIIYQDQKITITKDFVTAPAREAIRIANISKIMVGRKVARDYKAGAFLFFVIGVLTVVFVIGWLFLALAVGAWVTKEYKYTLYIYTGPKLAYCLEHKSKSYLMGIARTIEGLNLSLSLKEKESKNQQYAA